MKFFISSLLILVHNIHQSTAQSNALTHAYELSRAESNIDAAIANFGSDNVQPACFHPTDNYVKCISIADDIDDTEFVVHPVVQPGTTLGMLKGTADYNLGMGLIQAWRDTASTCSDEGSLQISKYPWLHQMDVSTPIMAQSVIKDFTYMGEKYICGSGPLTEEEVDDSPIIDFTGKQVRHSWDQNGNSFVSLFCDEETLVWTDRTDPDNLVFGRETFTTTKLSDEVVMYEWKESPLARDFVLVWTFNFDTKRVYGVIGNVFPDSNLNLSADYEVIDNLEVEEGYATCDYIPDYMM